MTDLAYKTVALVVLFLALVLNACDFQKYEPSAPSPTQTASLLDIAERYVSGAIAHPEALCGPFSSYGGFRSNFIHWTPDGSSLIFNEKEPYYPYDGGVIKMASVEGAQHRTIVDANPDYEFKDGFHADLSPDGSTIVYSSCQFALDQRLLAPFELEDIDLYIDTWGPWRHYEIATVDVGGGGPRRLTNNNRVENYPMWSPDGTQIAFLSTEEYHLAENTFSAQVLYTMDEDGSNVRDIASSEKIDAISYLVPSPPVWSLDGQLLAFLAYESTSAKKRKILYVIGADGTDLRRIAEVTGTASWSPDSERLAFPKITGEYYSSCT